jgi:hypothetical protein
VDGKLLAGSLIALVEDGQAQNVDVILG